MLRNYFTTIYRNLRRNKLNTFINVTGLTVSIACCIVIYVFVKSEKTFDHFHSKADQIYRIVFDDKTPQGTEHGGYTSFAVAGGLRNDFPELETVTQVYIRNTSVIQIPGADNSRKTFEEKDINYADQYFLKTFDFPIIAGERKNLLSTPDEVVLTRKLADKFFGKEYAGKYEELIGKVIVVDKQQHRITAILEDMPRNSNIACTMLMPFLDFERDHPNATSNWRENYSEAYTFITLPKNYSAKRFESALVAFKNKYHDAEFAKRLTYHPQPLKDVHSDNKYGGTIYSTPAILILAFITMGAIVLLTACINFINLATAQSLKRAKEIGIRKTLGSRNWQLVFRFMSETFILVAISSVVAVILAEKFLEGFNNYLSFIIDLGLHTDLTVIFFLVALGLVITFLAGYYPAKIMASFQPIKALKSTITAKNTGFGNRFSLRKGLVVTQFIVVQLLIIGTIVVASQMKYFYSRDLGYRKDGILTVEVPGSSAKLELLKNKLLTNSAIEDVSFSSGPPTSSGTSFGEFRLPQSGTGENMTLERKFVDPAFTNTYDIKVIAGRNLRDGDLVTISDTAKTYNVLLNQKAVSMLGFTKAEDAIGKEILINSKDRGAIVGVTENFYNASLQKDITPCLLFFGKNWVSYANIRMSGALNAQNMSFIQKSWEELYPDNMFKALTLNDYIRTKGFYVLEDIMYQGFKLFVVLAIIIGCLGLYGLVAFLAIQRQKEIGIRKVLGASVNGIVYLFSKEFGILILVAFVIAAPLGYLAMDTWLQTFVNRIDLHTGYFVAAFIISMIIAGITVSFQSIKAAVANPVKSLRAD